MCQYWFTNNNKSIILMLLTIGEIECGVYENSALSS